jgi:uncharacterized membrane protein YfcA
MIWQLLTIGFVAGIAGGLFGIGGGAIMVPAMVLLLGMGQKFSTGTSIIAQVLPIGILGAIVYYRKGNADIRQGVLLAVGLLLGFLIGAWYANRATVSDQFMKKLYGVFLFVIGARYLFYDAVVAWYNGRHGS